MITIEKEKPAKEALELFTVTVALNSDVGDSVQIGTKIQGHVAELEAFLEATGVNPEEYKLILKHAADVTLQDFMQQVVNLSKSIKGAKMKLMPWSDSNENHHGRVNFSDGRVTQKKEIKNAHSVSPTMNIKEG